MAPLLFVRHVKHKLDGPVTAESDPLVADYHATMREAPGGAPVIRVLIADQIAHIVEQLSKLADFADEIQVCGIARRRDELIEEARLRHPDVLIVSSDLGDTGTRALAGELAEAAPRTGILVVAPTPPSNGTVPGGANAVVYAGASGTELAVAIRKATRGVEPMQEVTRRERRKPNTKGELLVVYSGKGGVGTSFIASNLAVALAAETEARVALVDLDLQYGDAGVMLHVEHHQASIEDLTQEADLDAELLEEVLASGPEDVRVLLAPSSPELGDLVTGANLRAILRELQNAYDYVVVDAPSHLEERTLEVIELADQILLVTGFNVTTVNSTRSTLKLLQSLGLEKERIALVLNQTRQRVSFPRDEIEQLLRFRMVAQLPYDPHVDDSVDSGQPLVLAEPKSEMSRQFRTLASFLAPEHEASDEHRDAASRGRPARRRFSIGRR